MKVILLQDVARLGKRFSVVEVPNGYAINQLIPKKLAKPATDSNLKQLDKIKNCQKKTTDLENEQFEVAVGKLIAEPLAISLKANEQGHLFKEVKPSDIVMVAKNNDINISEKYLIIPETIKVLGQHKVILRKDKKDCEFTLEVKSE